MFFLQGHIYILQKHFTMNINFFVLIKPVKVKIRIQNIPEMISNSIINIFKILKNDFMSGCF